MFEAFLIYIYLVAVDLATLAIIFGVILVLLRSMFDFFYFMEGDQEKFLENLTPTEREFEMQFRRIRKTLSYKLSIAMLVIGLLIPSTDRMKLILGGAIAYNGIVKVSEIEGVERLPENLVNLANHFMEELQVEESEK